MTALVDDAQRAEALDPRRSFLVEAPAGSGKTELLIRRYLTLLTRVERPEQIVAITFTRKAAAEMRQRIVETLRAAADEDAVVPPHRRESRELARRVMAHSERSGWSLIGQPRRLRIMTIDALSAGLAQRLPLSANGVAGLRVAENARRLHVFAAQRVTESLAERTRLGDALRQLLVAADNSLATLEVWLAASLQQRDGWMRELFRASAEPLAANVGASVERLGADRVAGVRSLVSPEAETRLFAVLEARHEAGSKDGNGSMPPAGDIGNRNAGLAWRLAAALLLKKDGNWRRRFTRAEGFPPGNEPLHQELQRSLRELKRTPGLREALAELAATPEAAPTARQRERLTALETVLPQLLAELSVVFAEHGAVDYTELGLAAERALGTVDEPSELLLALDRRIEHILVDEFQDTSHLQWRLLEKLTAGWEPGDGRTLFLVGDPMQSIYRFRDADLSLFIQAARSGLGNVELHPIALSRNFRSAARIVDWVNTIFSRVFPAEESLVAATPAFRPSVAGVDRETAAEVQVRIFRSEDHGIEIDCVIETVRRALRQDPGQSIGILVRSRAHLKGLKSALADAGLQAHAVEIDSLTDTQVGQDLIGFTAALLHEGDRLSWLGVLRGRWCGLGWPDLHALVGDAPERSVWSCLADGARLDRLSTEGRRRALWLRERLNLAMSLRPTRTFGRWIRDSWWLIDGPATLRDAHELELARTYFASLDGLSRLGDLDDPTSLRAQFAEPSEGSEPVSRSGVEIMTMHRAKGLEFDTVVLPALGRTPRGNDSNLLYFQDIYLSNLDRVGLLAVASGAPDPIRDYLKTLQSRHEAAERARLLYVAATRARQRLHLIGRVNPKSGRPRSGSLLATLWPCLGTVADDVPVADSHPAAEVVLTNIEPSYLGLDDEPPVPPGVTSETGTEPSLEFEWVHPASVQVGTLVHRELQRVAEAGAKAGTPVPPAVNEARYRRELALLGVETEDLDDAATRVADALGNVWSDPVGRWILNPWTEAWSELRLTVRADDRLEHIQLDRSFVDDGGCRWIIDYKTGRHLGGDPTRFLDNEVERYRGQLERYASAVAETDPRPIRVGLYFPLMACLKDWEPGATRLDGA